MAQVIADQRDVEFVLHEQLNVEELSKHEKFADFNKKTLNLIVKEARNIAIKELLPTYKEGDDQGCKFKDGKVSVPECFHRPYELMKEGDWIALNEDPEWGGQGMPRIAEVAAYEYLIGGNYPLVAYAKLTHGAGQLVENFGTDKQKELFLKKMYAGEWCGTMLLTEPNAGSDVGALTTTAVKNDDETYSITGEKIFISAGEHDLAENIIHPVLARIEGAPAGTRGISLFLVPKIWVNDDGTLGEPNDVVCTGVEEKMGIHGNATCTMSLGSKGKCRGTLLGEENKGMKAMFLMMNGARIMVGMQSLSASSSSYLNALDYARKRIQGKKISEAFNPDAPSVSIINHPDVRRMLLTMKAYTEGMRSLLYYTTYYEDKTLLTDTPEEKERYQNIVDILIPIAKGYVSEKGVEMASLGMQVFGGYGYTKEYPQEQILRDSKIACIYEGTTTIQGMDLLGRKLGLNKGKAVMRLFKQVQKTVTQAKETEATKEFALEVEKIVNKLGEVGMHLGGVALSKPDDGFAFANTFLEVTGDVVMAWMLLWRAAIAAQKLDKAKKKDIPFYQGLIKSCEFFVYSILPVTFGKMKTILIGNNAVTSISDESFGGK